MRIVMTEEERRATVEKLKEISEWLDNLVPPDEIAGKEVTDYGWRSALVDYRDRAVRKVEMLKTLFEE